MLNLPVFAARALLVTLQGYSLLTRHEQSGAYVLQPSVRTESGLGQGKGGGGRGAGRLRMVASWSLVIPNFPQGLGMGDASDPTPTTHGPHPTPAHTTHQPPMPECLLRRCAQPPCL